MNRGYFGQNNDTDDGQKILVLCSAITKVGQKESVLNDTGDRQGKHHHVSIVLIFSLKLYKIKASPLYFSHIYTKYIVHSDKALTEF